MKTEEKLIRYEKSVLEISKKFKVKCLSKKIDNTNDKLIWECKKSKHQWKEALRKIKERTKKFDKIICSQCHQDNFRAEQLEKCQVMAKSQKGKLLSKEYKDSKSKLLVQCEKKHTWEISSSNLLKGNWCPFCAGQKGITIKDFIAIAKQNEGECLSTKYVNSKTNLRFRCKKGHHWSALPSNIKKGHWCPECSVVQRSGTRKYTIEDIINLVKEKKGICFTRELNTLEDYIKIECEKGHVWETKAKTLLHKGSWCIYCAKNSAVRIEDVELHCEKFGFKLLSKKYESNKKLKIKCPLGHDFEIRWSNLSRGRGCPECSQGIGERVCREVFQVFFGKKFPRQKPDSQKLFLV